MSAYMFTQYNALFNDNPFTNFVIVDNGYVEYYNKNINSFIDKVRLNGNKVQSQLNVYRIWGELVDPNPEAIRKQIEAYKRIESLNVTNLNNYLWLAENANHADTQTLGIDNALRLTLGLDFATTEI